MIGKLQGIVDYIGDGFIIIMAGNVGYKVYCPEYPALESTVSLWIETVVREDSIRLFGFSSAVQQDLFNQLTTVSGVGPKVAMTMLGVFKAETLLTAIATGDAKTITAAPGVGKKMAEKIIVELKGKNALPAAGLRDAGRAVQSSAYVDLLSALESLGYRRADMIELAQSLSARNPDSDVGALVRLALKEISK
jgi:Holliday junction DNA helicase RuvA